MVLINLQPGTTLRLLAMTREGQLTAMETVFAPTEPDRLVLDVQDNRLPGDESQHVDLQTYQIEVGALSPPCGVGWGRWDCGGGRLRGVSGSLEEKLKMAGVCWRGRHSVVTFESLEVTASDVQLPTYV